MDSVFCCIWFSLVLLFLQCFDTVGWVIWPVKTRPRYDHNVFGGTLNLAHSLTSGVGMLCCLSALMNYLAVELLELAPNQR